MDDLKLSTNMILLLLDSHYTFEGSFNHLNDVQDGGVMKEKAMQSMSTLSSAQIVAGLPHPAYHHTVPYLQKACPCDYVKT